jgi:hypothetical protein
VNNNLAESTVIVFLLFVVTVLFIFRVVDNGRMRLLRQKYGLARARPDGGKGNKEKDILDKALVSVLSVRQHFPVEGQC